MIILLNLLFEANGDYALLEPIWIPDRNIYVRDRTPHHPWLLIPNAEFECFSYLFAIYYQELIKWPVCVFPC